MAESLEKQEHDSKCKLIINYLPHTVSDQELLRLFTMVGPVERCRVAKDQKSGNSLCYGFVTFAEAKDAKEAIDRLNGMAICNKRIKVSYAGPPTKNSKLSNLYISHLPRDITEKYLDDLFGRFGEIVNKHIMKDKITGNLTGVAFVRFDNPQDAQRAIEQMNGKVPMGGTSALVVKVADSRNKRSPDAAAAGATGTQQLGIFGPGPRLVVDQTMRIEKDGRLSQFIHLNPPGSFSVIWSDRQFRYNPVRNERFHSPLERYNPIGNGGGYF